jgi:hypothetical protein
MVFTSSAKKKRPQEARPKRRTERRPTSMKNSDKIACCNQCKQPLTKIDNYGERLTGCLTCNLWATGDGTRWKRLSEEDLRALHLLARHGD